eukprot:gene20945-27147_t
MHVDEGVMIAMTSGYYQGDEPADSSGLYLLDNQIGRCKAKYDDDALILLIGEGSNWLLNQSFRPVPHQLVAGINGKKATRAWYGRMILPSNDQMISIDKQTMSYGDYRLDAVRQVEGELSDRHVGRQLFTTTTCTTNNGEPGIECWISNCLSVAALSCGESAYCVDPTTNELYQSSDMCMNCIAECIYHNTSSYCTGSGTTMFMDGFHSQLLSPVDSVQCINLFFTTWTLDNSVKFAFACIGVLLMGIVWRLMFNLFGPLNNYLDRVRRIGSRSHITLSYSLMLAAMTFSYELFFMVVSGITIGHVVNLLCFNESVQGGGSPCCNDDGKVDTYTAPSMNPIKVVYHGVDPYDK